MPGQFHVPLETVTLFQRLSELLGLQKGSVQPDMALWPGILPVIEIAELLGTIKAAHAALDLDITPAGTPVVAFTVPAGKRWRIIGAFRSAVTSQYARVGISDGIAYVALTAGGTTGAAAQLLTPPAKLYIPATWVVYVESTDDIGDTARSLDIAYVEEDSLGF